MVVSAFWACGDLLACDWLRGLGAEREVGWEGIIRLKVGWSCPLAEAGGWEWGVVGVNCKVSLSLSVAQTHTGLCLFPP